MSKTELAQLTGLHRARDSSLCHSLSNQVSGKAVHCRVTTTNCEIKSNQGLLIKRTFGE